MLGPSMVGLDPARIVLQANGTGPWGRAAFCKTLRQDKVLALWTSCLPASGRWKRVVVHAFRVRPICHLFPLEVVRIA